MSDPNPPQSLWASVVDLAILASIVAMAFGQVKEPVAWTLLGGIVSGRFGISFGKSIERVKMSGGSSDGGGGGGGTGKSGSTFKAVMPDVRTEGGPIEPKSRMELLRMAMQDLLVKRAAASMLVFLATLLVISTKG